MPSGIKQYLNRVICGDCLDALRTLPGGFIQCCVTSPPYWGLRDYGVDGQLGLEQTPEEYVAKMVEVFREVRRVLKKDATCWVNLGDSYASFGHIKGHSGFGTSHLSRPQEHTPPRRENNGPGLKHKDLVGIPWRVAFALQADGWWLRQEIIWSKPNCMPESVRDRFTKSHEQIFLLSTSKQYYFDLEAIKEPVNGSAHRRGSFKEKGSWNGSQFHTGKTGIHQLGRSQKKRGVTPKSAAAGSGIRANESFHSATYDLVENRNRRSVWTIPTHPLPEAHFATFPPKLIEPCILAGSRMGDVVLDPFMGAGTTAVVAANLGRKYLGIELNPDYCRMAENRIARETAQLNMFHQCADKETQ